MALDTSNHNCQTPLHFKGLSLKHVSCSVYACGSQAVLCLHWWPTMDRIMHQASCRPANNPPPAPTSLLSHSTASSLYLSLLILFTFVSTLIVASSSSCFFLSILLLLLILVVVWFCSLVIGWEDWFFHQSSDWIWMGVSPPRRPVMCRVGR